tara:strand:- start:188 stop:463 length:276 start_codon:yes stop_codon:yes gene_type:complete
MKVKKSELKDLIREELRNKTELTEVGAAPLYRKHIKRIEKAYKIYGKEVLDFYEVLRKQGVHDESLNLLTQFRDNVLKFGKSFKQLIKKLL